MLDRELRAALIAELQEARTRMETMLALLLPEEEEVACPHPRERMLDLSSMGEPLYRCGLCNAEQDTPFISTL